MFARIVSLIMVAAVIACPLSCRAWGFQCCTDCSGSSSEHTPPSACAMEGESHCCCDHSSRPQEKEHLPEREPTRMMCQGMCGGAVLTRLCELDSPELSFLLPLTGNERTLASLQVRHRMDRFALAHPGGKKNLGRFMRTLHLSFLC